MLQRWHELKAEDTKSLVIPPKERLIDMDISHMQANNERRLYYITITTDDKQCNEYSNSDSESTCGINKISTPPLISRVKNKINLL